VTQHGKARDPAVISPSVGRKKDKEGGEKREERRERKRRGRQLLLSPVANLWSTVLSQVFLVVHVR